MARARRAVIGDTEAKESERGGGEGLRSGLGLDLCASVSLSKALKDFKLSLQTQDGFNGNFPTGTECLINREDWEDLLEDGGLKVSELGSCSASVALGSEVAISPPVMDLCLGNNSAANTTGRQHSSLKYQFSQFIAIYLRFRGLRRRIYPPRVGVCVMAPNVQFGDNCA